jgi:hypothetical protein
MSNTQRSGGVDELETFWMSGAAEEPALELVDGQLRPIQQEAVVGERPRTSRRQLPQPRLSPAPRMLSDLVWD